MQNISDKFKEQLNKGNRNYNAYVDITLSDETVLNITNSDIWQGSFSIEDSVSGDSEFQIGSAIINKFSISLNNMKSFPNMIFMIRKRQSTSEWNSKTGRLKRSKKVCLMQTR